MKRISLLAAVVATLGVSSLFAFSGPSAANADACGCINCQCPVCDGTGCSCDGCECAVCACAK